MGRDLIKKERNVLTTDYLFWSYKELRSEDKWGATL